MRRLTAMFVAFLSFALCGTAEAQDFSGTYAAQAGAGPGLTLVLRQSPQGQVTGTLTGRMQFQIQAQAQGGQVTGYAVAQGGRLFLQGQLQGGGLMLALAEVGSDGQPQQQTAQTVMLSRTGGADAAGALGAAPQGKPGAGTVPAAPGRRGRAAGAAVPSDPYVGTFSNGSVAITLTPSSQGYTGTASAQGQQMPLIAQNAGDRISGVYQMNGVQLPFQAQVQGDAMVLATNDGTFQLQRTSGAMTAPGGGMGAPGAMGGAGGGVAASGQDGQISQLLLSGAWCYFSFSQTSGTSHTERVIFRGDGSGAQSTGGESYNSGPNGSVAGQSQGGQQFRWRVQSGMLVVTGQDGQSSQVPLQIARNSSGSPIVTAGGKEYARCN